MADAAGILVARGDAPHRLLLPLANRHGLIAGATGTGKTVTLRVMAEGLAAAGVPVFIADVKGDLAGLARAGDGNPKFAERAARLGVEGYASEAQPAVFWDLFGEQGHPVRTTVSDMGPLLFARLLELSDVQAGVLEVAFKLADDQGLHLDDLKDLRGLLQFMSENAKDLQQSYGNVTGASVGAIQRGLVALQAQGGDRFLGLPELDIRDFLKRDGRGRGLVHVLAADKLMMRPRLYATFLLWLLSELFEELDEVGDLDQPRLVFFFDEAHLLFADATPALVQAVEQVVRLIRSKGVGVYFCTQNPLDLPESVLGQLGNRVQHALRAFTPRDQKAVKTAADTFRPNPKLKTAEVITQLAVGEALVSFLDEKGTPGVVDRALVCPPRSFLGPIPPDERKRVIEQSPFAGRYDAAEDRESAAEMLAARRQAAEAPPPAQPSGGGGILDSLGGIFRGGGGGGGGAPAPASRARGRQPDSIGASVAKSVARNVAAQIGRDLGGALGGRYGRQVGGSILRGVLGSILRGR